VPVGRHGLSPRDKAANLIWSAKDAALKVLKVGLRADTREIELEFDLRAARRRRCGSRPAAARGPVRADPHGHDRPRRMPGSARGVCTVHDSTGKEQR